MLQVKPFIKQWNIQTEAVILFYFKDLKQPKVDVPPQDLNKVLLWAKEDGFQGDKGTMAIIRPPAKSLLGKKVVLTGLGERKDLTRRTFREAVGNLVRNLKLPHAKWVLVLPSAKELDETGERVAQLATEGIFLGLYRFENYFSEAVLKQRKKLRSRHFFLYSQTDGGKALKDGMRKGRIFARATMQTRDLVNEGASVVTPEHLAHVSKKLGRTITNVSVEVLEEKALRKRGFGGIYGVGRGSSNPPRFIRMVYNPDGGKPKKRIALVGKGVTFDSGGVNIKPTSGIETMKEDMSGAGAVIGVFSALGKLDLNLQVIGLIGAAENMVDGNSYKPGDVLRTYGGKTIEIINTDAEGRLVLADALGYCVKEEEVDIIIDMATLTGAAALALGPQYTVGFFTDDKLKNEILSAGERAGERIWPFPLEKEYKSDLKSEFADVRNAPVSRRGGTIHGALFLQHFLEDTTAAWGHLDIAPVAWSTVYRGHITYGGTGTAVRTVLEFLTNL